MEEKTMTTQEAYADFYAWIRADKNKWDSLEMKERRYLRKTASEARLGNQIGNARIENIFGKFQYDLWLMSEGELQENNDWNTALVDLYAIPSFRPRASCKKTRMETQFGYLMPNQCDSVSEGEFQENKDWNFY